MSGSPIPTFTVKSPNKLKGRNSKRSCQPPNKSTTNLECICSPPRPPPTSLIMKTSAHPCLSGKSPQVGKRYTKQTHHSQGAPFITCGEMCSFFFFNLYCFCPLYFSDLGLYGLILVLPYFQVREKPAYERFTTEKYLLFSKELLKSTVLATWKFIRQYH